MNAPYLNRTYVFDVLLNRSQRKALDRLLASQRGVYNAALQERIDAWRWAKGQAALIGLASPSKKALKGIDREALDPVRKAAFDRLIAWKVPDWYSQSAAMSQRAQKASLGDILVNDPSTMTRWTLERLDKAFQGFFDRVKAGGTPGFPRFRAFSRWSTLGWMQTQGKTLRIIDNPRLGHRGRAALTLPGLPGKVSVRMHGSLPDEADIRAATMTRRGTRWRIALSCRMPATHGVEADAMLHDLALDEVVGLDWGVAQLVTSDDGVTLENQRHADRLASKVRRAQRVVARAKRGSNSRKAKVACLAGLKRQEANSRKTAMRQGASRIVDAALKSGKRVVAVEKLAAANMTRSARGTVEIPGHNVRAKSGLNRSIYDAAPAAFVGHLRTKAESAGLRIVLVDPKRTSILCSSCGIDVPKSLSTRVHRCACGVAMDRDHNAALNIRQRGWRAARSAAAAALEKERSQAAVAA